MCVCISRILCLKCFCPDTYFASKTQDPLREEVNPHSKCLLKLSNLNKKVTVFQTIRYQISYKSVQWLLSCYM